MSKGFDFSRMNGGYYYIITEMYEPLFGFSKILLPVSCDVSLAKPYGTWGGLITLQRWAFPTYI